MDDELENKIMFYDFVISGAGLAGTLVACALKKLGYSFYIFDSAPKESIDKRTSTISKASADFLNELGVWQILEEYATPILDIFTYEKDCRPFLHFENLKETEKTPMGWVVPNTELKKAFNQNLEIIYAKNYKEIYTSGDKVRIIFDDGSTIESRYLISAEGRNSRALRLLKVPNFSTYYKQACIICNLKSSQLHKNVAREIFLPSGPFALLPLKEENEFSLIWTTKFEFADSLKNIKEEDFLEEISKISGINFTHITTERVSYPVKLHIALRYYKKNVIFIGDCVHSIHPVAGQGFNLAIYDLNDLYQKLKDYGIDALKLFTREYSIKRMKANFKMALFTDVLVRGFCSRSRVLKVGRNIALDTINNFGSLKNFFIRKAMGF